MGNRRRSDITGSVGKMDQVERMEVKRPSQWSGWETAAGQGESVWETVSTCLCVRSARLCMCEKGKVCKCEWACEWPWGAFLLKKVAEPSRREVGWGKQGERKGQDKSIGLSEQEGCGELEAIISQFCGPWKAHRTWHIRGTPLTVVKMMYKWI